jgi:hypothetical protein
VNVEAVWEALGNAGESRDRESRVSVARECDPATEVPETSDAANASWPADDRSERRRFSMRFDWRYRVAAFAFGVTPGSAYVEVAGDRVEARFGPWLVQTTLSNVEVAEITGAYHLLKTAGPPHVSISDGGLTFASNRDRGVCMRFVEPVPGVDPLGLVRHRGLTVTVDDVDGLRRALMG